ncbi:MAG TPA: hypothetical protein VNO75_12705 [Gemmatimonadaceae bacterium]|nr:hypothetical protein [Gemmatimonadaceae bacterium]
MSGTPLAPALMSRVPIIFLVIALLLSAFLVVVVQNCRPTNASLVVRQLGASRPPCAQHKVSLAPEARPDGKKVEMFDHLRGGLTWALLVLAFGLAVVATLVASVRILLSERARKNVWMRVLEFSGVALVAGLALPTGNGLQIGENLLGGTVYLIPTVEHIVGFAGGLAAVTLVALTMAVCAILADAASAGTEDDPAPITDPISRIRNAQEDARMLLYAGAVCLAAGTLQVSAIYSWGISMLAPDGSFYVSTEGIPEAMGMLNGSFFSILLAIIFLPVFLQLRARAVVLARNAKPGSELERRKWMEEQGIQLSITKQLATIAAMLAPFVAGGPITSLVGFVTK